MLGIKVNFTVVGIKQLLKKNEQRTSLVIRTKISSPDGRISLTDILIICNHSDFEWWCCEAEVWWAMAVQRVWRVLQAWEVCCREGRCWGVGVWSYSRSGRCVLGVAGVVVWWCRRCRVCYQVCDCGWHLQR